MNQLESADRYSMILEWEPEGSVYVVTVPELPGCQTHGATRAAAVRQGQEAITGWIEDARSAGEPVPSPAVLDLGLSESMGNDGGNAPVGGAPEAVTAETGQVALR